MTDLPMRPAADQGQTHHNQPLPQQSEGPKAKDGVEPVANCCLVPVMFPNDPIEAESRQTFYSVSSSLESREALSVLSNMLNTSAAPSQTWLVAQWTHLADLSKHEPFWRPLFGPLTRAKSQYRFEQGPSTSNTCVLEAAALAVGQAVNDSIPNEAVRPVLRLIANCCADNNINRSLAINSPLVLWLQRLLKREVEVDVLLPTLYNVCVDYDEPASDTSGTVYCLSGQMQDGGVGADDTHLTKAEAQLQICRFLELDEKHYESCGALLADLLELSSRSALFDISIILGKAQGSEDDEHLERASILCDLFLSKGSLIASTSTEAQASICQTCMNLFSQPIMQRALVQSHAAVQQFIDLPYLAVIEEDEDVNLSAYREAFLKLMYAVSALPDYTISCSPGSTLLEALTDRLAKYISLKGFEETVAGTTSKPMLSLLQMPLMGDVSPIASVLLLINNALSDRPRIDAFLDDHQTVCEQIMAILLCCPNENIILLALKLASRLAMSPTGANKIFSTDVHFSIISRLLTFNSSPKAQPSQAPHDKAKHTLAIQHELIIFVRLLNKGQARITAHFIHNNIFSKLLTHSTPTVDASFKLETARLCIEILRNLASRTSSQSDTSAISSGITAPAILPHFISALLFLLTSTSTASAAQSEALFGLGIFTSVFTSPNSPHFNPSAMPPLLREINKSNDKNNEEKPVLNIFRRIAATPANQETGTNGGGGGTTTSSSTSKADYENLRTILTHILLASSLRSTSVSTATIPAVAAAAAAGRESDAYGKGNDESVDLSHITYELEDIAQEMGMLKDTARE